MEIYDIILIGKARNALNGVNTGGYAHLNLYRLLQPSTEGRRGAYEK